MPSVDVRICDDGTLDTVVEVYCDICGYFHEFRYAMEASNPYRDDTGALDVTRFAAEVVVPDFEFDECYFV
jgi:hypothetical protein